MSIGIYIIYIYTYIPICLYSHWDAGGPLDPFVTMEAFLEDDPTLPCEASYTFLLPPLFQADFENDIIPFFCQRWDMCWFCGRLWMKQKSLNHSIVSNVWSGPSLWIQLSHEKKMTGSLFHGL